MTVDPELKTYLSHLSPDRKEKVLLAAIEHLIETEDVRFLSKEEADGGNQLYWLSCGEPLWY